MKEQRITMRDERKDIKYFNTFIKEDLAAGWGKSGKRSIIIKI